MYVIYMYVIYIRIYIYICGDAGEWTSLTRAWVTYTAPGALILTTTPIVQMRKLRPREMK